MCLCHPVSSHKIPVYWIGMPVFWYLKALSSVTWSSIVSIRKFILFGGFLAIVTSFTQLYCLGLTGHLYLKLTACVNNRNYLALQNWCFLRWIHGDRHSCQEQANAKMAPTIGGICEDNTKDRDDVIVKERSKVCNNQGKQNHVRKYELRESLMLISRQIFPCLRYI